MPDREGDDAGGGHCYLPRSRSLVSGGPVRAERNVWEECRLPDPDWGGTSVRVPRVRECRGRRVIHRGPYAAIGTTCPPGTWSRWQAD